MEESEHLIDISTKNRSKTIDINFFSALQPQKCFKSDGFQIDTEHQLTALQPQADDTYHGAPLTYGAHKPYCCPLILGEVYGYVLHGVILS